MNPIPVLGIPHYNRPDLLRRCVESIDYPVDTLVVIQNGPDAEAPPLGPLEYWLRHAPQVTPRRAIWIRHHRAGCAGAWNEIIKLFPGADDTGGHWWLVANNDIAFMPGDLEAMAAAVAGRAASGVQASELFLGNHGFSWFALTQRCVEVTGLFDENLYPVYLEDCDYAYRMALSGLAIAAVPGLRSLHGYDAVPGSSTIHSDGALREKNHRTHGANSGYYRLKWGGINGEEKFPHPFNDPAFPIWAWRFAPHLRRANQW